MFSWEKFIEGECYVRISNRQDFDNFMQKCGEHDIHFTNHALCGSEQLHEDSLGTTRMFLVNENNVKRYSLNARNNYYIVINGRLRKKTHNSSALADKQMFNYYSVAMLDFVDEDGFEREVY